MKIRKGCTRIVFVFRSYVIKVPNFTKNHLHFLQGCYANYAERSFCKNFKYYSLEYDKVSPTIYCSWFGLFSIQKRVIELSRPLIKKEIKYFKTTTIDLKYQNFGYLNNKLVCIDYV